MISIKKLLMSAHIKRSDAEALLGFVLSKTKTELFLSEQEDVSIEHQILFASLLKRYQENEPIEYIICSKEFFGRSFAVGAGVLIPRPSTEILVQEVLLFLHNNHQVIKQQERIVEADTDIVIVTKQIREGKVEDILDIGTGSAIIPITLLKEGCTQTMIGVDLSKDASHYAMINREKHHLNDQLILRHENGIETINNHQRPFFVVSNPPYIPNTCTLEPSVQNFEPHAALFAGIDGMDVIRPMIQAITANPLCLGFAVECREDQVGEMEKRVAMSE